MIFPDWAIEEEEKIYEEYFSLPDNDSIDPEVFCMERASDGLKKLWEEYEKDKQENWEKGIIVN